MTMNMHQIAEKLSTGESATTVMRGSSMTPIIRSGDTVTIDPLGPKDVLARGDVVFCRVNGRYYLHRITAIQGNRFQIGNNHGHINGWTKQILGVLSKIEGR